MLSNKELQEYRARIRPQGTAEAYRSEIGRNLKKARENIHLSQEDVAEILEVSRKTIGRYERGEVSCSIEQLDKFCCLYGCRLVDLLPKKMLPNVSELEAVDPALLKTLQVIIGNTLSRTA